MSFCKPNNPKAIPSIFVHRPQGGKKQSEGLQIITITWSTMVSECLSQPVQPEAKLPGQELEARS
jgi:hypothetical protein